MFSRPVMLQSYTPLLLRTEKKLSELLGAFARLQPCSWFEIRLASFSHTEPVRSCSPSNSARVVFNGLMS